MDLSRILADLEGQFDAQLQRDHREEVGEFAEGELRTVSLTSRIRARIGQPLTVRSATGELVTGTVRAVTDHWLLLDSGAEEIVQLCCCASVEPLAHSAPSASVIESGLTFSHVLRQIARRRIRVRMSLAGTVISGAIVAVYADHIDIRTETAVISVLTEQIFSVRSVVI